MHSIWSSWLLLFKKGKKSFTLIGTLVRKNISTEMLATLNATTYGVWSTKRGIGTWDKLQGCVWAWVWAWMCNSDFRSPRLVFHSPYVAVFKVASISVRDILSQKGSNESEALFTYLELNSKEYLANTF